MYALRQKKDGHTRSCSRRPRAARWLPRLQRRGFASQEDFYFNTKKKFYRVFFFIGLKSGAQQTQTLNEVLWVTNFSKNQQVVFFCWKWNLLDISIKYEIIRNLHTWLNIIFSLETALNDNKF